MLTGADVSRWLAPVRELWRHRSARGWILLIAVTVVGAAGGAGAGYWAKNRVAQRYTATAVFSVNNIAPDMTFLSFSKSIEAEQVARVLDRGLSGQLARAAAGPRAHYDATWVPGPAVGQVSFRVRTADPALAWRVAAAVFDASGPSGRELLRPEQPRPGIAPVRTTASVALYHRDAKVVLGAAAIGAATSVGVLALIWTAAWAPYPPRRAAAALAG